MKRHALQAALAGLAACALGAAAAGAGSAQATTAPCGTISTSAAHYKHVIWIWEENHSYNTIIGSSQAPYINGLAKSCGLATNDHNITHPSLPNYVGAIGGEDLLGVAKFVGDCDPSTLCSTSDASIFSQTPSWKAYEDSMPSNCLQSNSGAYAVRHNPPPYFTSLSGCATKDVPYTALAGDLSRNRLPAFSFITPNLLHDMHDGTIAQGDTWLKRNLPTILNSSEYKTGTVAVFVTWDEGEGGSSYDCASNTSDVGCHVATLVISPSTKRGTRSGTLFNHYSLLRSAEELLHLPLLGQARSASSMVRTFGL